MNGKTGFLCLSIALLLAPFPTTHACSIPIKLNSFFADPSDSGKITWDLSGLGPSTLISGLEFPLNFNDDFFDSYAVISNLYQETATRVPEPPTMLLLGSGLVALFGVSRRKAAALKKKGKAGAGMGTG